MIEGFLYCVCGPSPADLFVSFLPILPKVVTEEGHVLLQLIYRAVIGPKSWFFFQGILDFICFPSLVFFVSKYTGLSS